MIRNMPCGKHHCAYDLSVAVLHEGSMREAWFSEFLDEGPSGHSSRKSGENSPCVSEFHGAR
jgi:ferritin-like protein